MWVFTTVGFFSVVQVRNDPTKLMIRARAIEDLKNLKKIFRPLKIQATPKADYAFRAIVGRHEWTGIMMKLLSNIDYTNFKNEVAIKHSKDRAKTYESVWWIMLNQLQNKENEKWETRLL